MITLPDDFADPPQDGGLPVGERPEINGALGAGGDGDGGLPTGPDPMAVAGFDAPSAETKRQMLDAANSVNASAGQPYPGDIAAMNGPSGGTGPNTINRLDATGPGPLPVTTGTQAASFPDTQVSVTPGVSTPGGGGLPTGQLSDADWKQAFEGKYGFFDPRFNSRENMLANAQRGDTAIKDQMAYMGGLDADARKIEGGIGAHPDFYRSQMAADWGGLHNAEIAQRVASGEFAQNAGGGGQGFNGRLGASPQGGGGQIQNLAALQNLESQQYRTPAGGVVPDSQAFPDGTKIVGELAQLKGVALAPDPIDGYGNIVFTENGQVRHIPMNEWGDWAGVIAQRLAAQNAPPAANGGGGGYGGRSYPPRGGGGAGGGAGAGGGGNAGVAQSPRDLYGPNPPNMAGYGPLDANRFRPPVDYGNTNFQPTQSVMPNAGWHIDPQTGLVADANSLPENIASVAGNVGGRALGAAKDVILGSNNNPTLDGWWSEDGVFHPTNP